MMGAKRIGILTGGGDVPGLNSVIKTVVYRGSEFGCEVIGIRRGWEGLTHVNLEDPASKARYVRPLDRDNTRTIATRMKKAPPHLSASSFPSMQITKDGATSTVYDMTSQVMKNIEKLGL